MSVFKAPQCFLHSSPSFALVYFFLPPEVCWTSILTSLTPKGLLSLARDADNVRSSNEHPSLQLQYLMTVHFVEGASQGKLGKVAIVREMVGHR